MTDPFGKNESFPIGASQSNPTQMGGRRKKSRLKKRGGSAAEAYVANLEEPKKNVELKEPDDKILETSASDDEYDELEKLVNNTTIQPKLDVRPIQPKLDVRPIQPILRSIQPNIDTSFGGKTRRNKRHRRNSKQYRKTKRKGKKSYKNKRRK